MRIAVFAALAWIAFTCSAQRAQEPPRLPVDHWLQAPTGFNAQWDTLRGKVVVLEFWATWCVPCVEAIPHLNQLADEFRDQNVVFLAVTDDDVERLKPFLARHPIHAIIGIDTARRSWESFAVPSIPHAVLIGKDGNIVGATLPENITREVLRDALAGKNPALPPQEGVAVDLEWDDHSIVWQDGVKPEMYAIIKPIKTAGSGAWPRGNHVTADGASLEVLTELAYNTDAYHIDWRMPQGNRTYRAAFLVPANRADRLASYMQQTLADVFDIKAAWQSETRDVYLLRRIQGRAPPPASAGEQQQLQMIRGNITLRQQPIGELCQLLTSAFDAIVVDETGLTGVYDFDVPYQHGNHDTTTQALRTIGLEVAAARRPVQILVVTPEH